MKNTKRLTLFTLALLPFSSMAQVAVLPDLVPLANEDVGWMYDYEVANIHDHNLDADDPADMHVDRTVIRFTGVLANLGSAPLDMVGGDIYTDADGDVTRDVYQNIYSEDGDIIRSDYSGTFVFHAGHDHVHYDAFAAYSMKIIPVGSTSAEEEIKIAESSKVGFCLLNSLMVDPDVYATDVTDIDPMDFLACSNERQLISPGHADVYDKALDDQWIDITGLKLNGTYILEVEADPLNQIQESDETNNITRIFININTVPEPSSTLLLGLGGLSFLLRRRR